jgi:hypothetical protein
MKHVATIAKGWQGQLQLIFLDNHGLPIRVARDTPDWSHCGSVPHDTVNKSYDDVAMGTSSTGWDLQLVLLGHNDGLLYLTQQDPNNGYWEYKYPLPHPMTKVRFTAVTAGTGVNGLFQVVCLGTDNNIHVIAQDRGRNYAYVGTIQTGGHPVFTALEFGNAGTPSVILLDNSGLPYVMRQDQNGWSSPVLMDNGPGAARYNFLATGISAKKGILNVVLLDKAQSLPYLIELDNATPQGKFVGPIPHYSSMPMPPFKALATGMGNDQTPQVICLGQDGQPYLIYQDHSTGDWHCFLWDNWRSLPTNVQKPAYTAVVAGACDRDNLQVVCFDGSRQPYRIEQDYQSGRWDYHGPLPYVTQVFFGNPVMRAGNNANFQVACVGDDKQLYLSWQDSSSREWSKFDLLPASGSGSSIRCGTAAMGVGNNGNVQVIGLQNGEPNLTWQAVEDGSWHFSPEALEIKNAPL